MAVQLQSGNPILALSLSVAVPDIAALALSVAELEKATAVVPLVLPAWVLERFAVEVNVSEDDPVNWAKTGAVCLIRKTAAGPRASVKVPLSVAVTVGAVVELPLLTLE